MASRNPDGVKEQFKQRPREPTPDEAAHFEATLKRVRNVELAKTMHKEWLSHKYRTFRAGEDKSTCAFP